MSLGRVLVTGGARRIGATLSRRLAEAGAMVVVHCHASTDEAAALVDELGPEHAWIQADLSDPQEAARLVPRVLQQLGPLDHVVNNASAYPQDTFHTMESDRFEVTLRTNAWAPFALMRAFARNGKGSVVNLLDTRLVDLDARHFSYHLSKAMLAAMTDAAARVLAPDVRVNGVAPGPVLEPVHGAKEGFMERMAALMPLATTPGPDDIADAVLYFLQAPNVTGQVLHVDGGRHLGRPIED